MKLSLPVAAAAAILVGGSACAGVQTRAPARVVAVTATPAPALAPDAPETLELTIRVPPGAQIEVSTPAGQVIGYLARYVEDSQAAAPVTYTLALPPGVDGDSLRSVRVQPSEGVRGTDLQVGTGLGHTRPD